MGVDLIFRLILFLYLICTLFLSPILAKDSKDTQKSPPPKTATYKYWNADRRILDLKGDPQTFYGQVYYDVAYNKEGRIKTVTRMGENREPQETYHLIWNRSGTQSEYKIEFLTPGNASRLDDYLYSNKLSHVRPGWIADFKSRKDGRPKEVSFSDKLGFTYYSYTFNYSYDRSVEMEVVESSYFDSNGDFVGRHLLFWEGDAWLKMIQYYDENNQIIEIQEFVHDFRKEETIRIITDGSERELTRKIIPFMPPDKYAYRLEWTGREIIDHTTNEGKIVDYIPKSFLSFSYGFPIVVGTALANNESRTGYTIGLGRRNFFRVGNMKMNIGLEMNWIDFPSDEPENDVQTLSYFLVGQLDPKIPWNFIPANLEIGVKFGGGLISPGYGIVGGLSTQFNLAPTPLFIGLTANGVIASGMADNIALTYWGTLGLVFGLNFEDRLTSLF